MLFLINVVIAVATFWNAAEDHQEARTKFRNAVGAEKAKTFRKLLLLWLVPILSIASLPLTWWESAASDRKIAAANTRAAIANQLAGEANRQAAFANERASSNDLARAELQKQVELMRRESFNLYDEMLFAEPRMMRDVTGMHYSLTNFAGTNVVIFTESPERCDDCPELGVQVAKTFRGAGWYVFSATNAEVKFRPGLFAHFNTNAPTSNQQAIVSGVAFELTKRKIAARGAGIKLDNRFRNDALLVWIGPRPTLQEALRIRAGQQTNRLEWDEKWRRYNDRYYHPRHSTLNLDNYRAALCCSEEMPTR